MKQHESEQDIQKAIADTLNLYGVCVILGAGKIRDSNQRFISLTGGFNGGRGIPDILFIYKGETYLIEVKKPGAKLNDNQEVFHKACRNQGVLVNIFYSIDDAISFVKTKEGFKEDERR